MPLINLDAVLNPLPELKDHILDYIPRATTSEFGIVALGSGINVDSFGRIYLDTQEYSDRLTAIETTAASTLETTVNTLEVKADELAASITQKLGTPNGIATLDSAGCIPPSQLPSYVDAVLEYESVAAFPTTGETGKIYVETAGNTTYRWSGTTYVKITAGEVSLVAGKKGIVTLTKDDVGLSNVDNTNDLNKPLSTATQTALTALENKAKRGIINLYDASLIYGLNERATLTNGDIVKSTVDGNTNDPNVNMTGWVRVDGLFSFTEMVNIQNPKAKDTAFVDFGVITGRYVYDPNQSLINNGGTIVNGWVLIPENNTVTPYHFGWTGNDLAADMEAFQKCFDAVKHGQAIRFWHTAHLEKQIGKHSDIYGTDGRSLGGLTLNGGQPCLIMRAKKNVTVILDSAEIFTETASQGILDLYKCHRCKVISGTLTGGNYLRETGEYKFPPIDGTTGHAEKGTTTTGFNTTTLNPDIGGISNNAVITQNETTGGYGKQFPQFDGTTAPTWGVWRGGQLGNHSEGVRVIGGFGNEILGTEMHGFNGSAIRLGLLRSLDGLTNYPRISNSDSRVLAPKGTKIRGTNLHNCYIGGCQSDRSIDTFFDDYNTVKDMGHPDASVAHNYIDPGYGFSTSRAMPNFKLHVNHNTFTRCFRKGIDCHQGSQLHCEKNTITGTMFHGIGIVVDDDFADTFYQPYFEHVGIIKDNEIESHIAGIFYANGQFGRARREGTKKRWEQLHVNITGNSIKSTSPFFYNYAHSPFYIAHNTFIFAAPYAHQKAVTGNKSGITIGSYSGRGFTSGDVISHNKFFNSKDGNFAYHIYVENDSKQTKAIKITENHFDISRWYQKDGADSMYMHNDVAYRSGLTPTPIRFGDNNIPQDSVIENNTVWDDFNHDIIASSTGGGSGLIGYPLIDGHGRVTGIQLLDGGAGYAETTTLSLREKGRSSGAALSSTIVNGVITAISVVNQGRFYRSSYGLTIPRGLVSYDMQHVSGSSCHDKGIGSPTDTGCVLSVVKKDLTAPVTPFSIESGVRWMNTNKEGQYAIHSGGVLGGTLSAWVKIASTNTVGQKAIAIPIDSIDESSNTNTNASILVNVLSDGFTVPSSVYVDGALSKVQKLNFDTPYLLTLSSSALSGSSIVFGSNSSFGGAFLDAKYAFIEIHRGYNYSANEVSDLFEMRRSAFGK